MVISNEKWQYLHNSGEDSYYDDEWNIVLMLKMVLATMYVAMYVRTTGAVHNKLLSVATSKLS